MKFIKGITLLFCLLWLSQSLSAVNVPAIRDTNKTKILDELVTRPPYPREYRLNRTQYLAKYGFDNESIRLINSFFNDQKLYIWYVVSPSIVYVFLLIVYIMVLALVFSGGALGLSILLLFVLIAWIIAWGFRIYGIIMLSQHKKIDLLFDLINYRKSSRKHFFFDNENDYYKAK